MRKDWSASLEGELVESGFVTVDTPAVPKSEMSMIDYDLEARLLNWGRVVSPNGKSGGNVSSAWATDFINNRNARDFKLALHLEMIQRPSAVLQIEKQVLSEAHRIDGWLIESAWTLLPNFEHKQALRLRYVCEFGDEYVRRKLRLRGRENLKLILWRAKTTLKQILAQPKKQGYSSNHNLTAG
jgi:hypothetical protein